VMSTLRDAFRGVVAKRLTGDKKHKVASLTGAAILSLLSLHAEPARASTYEGSRAAVHSDDLYIMRHRRRRRSGRRDTDRMLPLLDPLQTFRTSFTARLRATA